MLTVSELLAHAEDCERLANDAEFQRQRSLLLELAAKWRKLAETERNRPGIHEASGREEPRAGWLH